ncbi:hypothetical protein LCGC14_0576440 [marine sediment metagenome]|uniref:HTH asnC-type domain-containing protein n=1 Tax=marine sediment metagenome TaxID=412755 RepID=A0A0F9RHN0_9ZZZZ|nr:MAG: DNA-binding transcriptional regulator AsnC [Candidatus Lokiarchaeum sp. GC14_75]
MKEKEYQMDHIDRQILSIIQDDPNISHTRIARQINRSQPTVGLRLKKMKQVGLFQIQPGVNFKNTDYIVVFVNLATASPELIIEMARKCPFMLNAFRLSGIFNVMVLLANSNLKKLYRIINIHFRNNHNVQRVSMKIVSDIANDFILPMNLDDEFPLSSSENECIDNCEYCLKDVLENKA